MQYQSTLRIVSRRAVAATSACLVKVYPAEPCIGARHALGHTPLLAGRDEGCDIRIDDQSVSRRHARIQPTVEGCYVLDLGSTNGTFVNDQRVTKARLSNGESLRIGNSLFRFLDSNDIEAAYHEEIQRLASLDGLTETYNRRYLIEALEHELSRSPVSGRGPALLLFDVDRFGTIVERLGQAGGDYSLRELASCLRSTVRTGDVLARIGGEEFALLLPEIAPAMAGERAEEIRCLVQGHPFEYQAVKYSLTVSTGVATAADGETIAARELIHRADRRLSMAQRAGRNAMAS